MFAKGSLVYAKIVGYPHWPAKVTDFIDNNQVKVMFYESYSYGACSIANLEAYDEESRKKRNLKSLMKKRPAFKRAAAGIEAEYQKRLKASGKVSDRTVLQDLNKCCVKAKRLDDSKIEAYECKRAKLDSDSKALKSCFVKVNKLSRVEIDAAIKEGKIKDPQPSNQAITDQQLKNSVAQPPFSMEVLATHSVRLDASAQQFIGSAAMDLKLGQTAIKNCQEIDSDPESSNDNLVSIDDWKNYMYSKLEMINNPDKNKLFEAAFNMIETTVHLKMALGLNNPDPNCAIELLDNLKHRIMPRVDVTMLFKLQDVVKIIHQVTRYVGNVSAWNLNENDLEEFEDKAFIIRKLARDVFSIIVTNSPDFKQLPDTFCAVTEAQNESLGISGSQLEVGLEEVVGDLEADSDDENNFDIMLAELTALQMPESSA